VGSIKKNMLVKTKFSIKDLENLSGIKAHTIRIWEKRYNLLAPSRSDTNIRTYNLDSLKKLLNISFLYEHGYKISKIAELSKENLATTVTKLAKANQEEHSIFKLKMAMFQFDQKLFATTYEELQANSSFPEIFQSVFIPLLTELGILWQTGTIDPCHERFVSEMIKQKIILNIEAQYAHNLLNSSPAFALFLPHGEIHDIGLMYANYMCISGGINTIYLGSNISINSLHEVVKHHENIIFLTYLTVEPSQQDIKEFCENYNNSIDKKENNALWIMGSKTHLQPTDGLPTNIKLIKTIPQLAENLQTLKKR
jgi:MerR family transcriptional regulator, light-induced transcriptional regulator